MSDSKDRLFEVHAAFSRARDQRASDLKEANTDADVDLILENVDALQAEYFRAALKAMDRTGPQVEQAYEAAKRANAAVAKALAEAKALPERIRLTAKLADKVATLVKAA